MLFYSVDSLSERASFAVTVVPEIRAELQPKQETIEDGGRVNGPSLANSEDSIKPSLLLSSDTWSATSSFDNNDPKGVAKSDDDGGDVGIVETQNVDPDNRTIRTNDKKSLTHSSINGFTGSNVQSKNEYVSIISSKRAQRVPYVVYIHNILICAATLKVRVA